LLPYPQAYFFSLRQSHHDYEAELFLWFGRSDCGRHFGTTCLPTYLPTYLPSLVSLMLTYSHPDWIRDRRQSQTNVAFDSDRRFFNSGVWPASAKPHRASTRSRIIGDMLDNLKADSVDQGHVFGGCQARIIERIASIAADILAMFRSSIEHQHRVGGRVQGEHRKHSALVIMVEVKETVPGQDSVEAAAQR